MAKEGSPVRNKMVPFWIPLDGSGPHSIYDVVAISKIYQNNWDDLGYVVLQVKSINGIRDIISGKGGKIEVKWYDFGPIGNPFSGRLFCRIHLIGDTVEMWSDDVTVFEYDASEVPIYVKRTCTIEWSILDEEE